ncbi:NADH dehydrogenase [Salmonella enterica subsp. arizonae]|uniref:NADH dehydrogenase n=1 Tax=Salmonella enterica subsp. arizonae TaxID=59203 RepID=A0A2X4TDJ9_SALER|nr:NADH dehydrogenase [Salmonella enterica subsp. arizonae]
MPALPPRISSAAHNELTKLGVRVLTQTMVTSADEGGLHTKEGEYIQADLMVWAAGIKAPDFMREIGAWKTNRINQLVVESTLQTTRDPDIFAMATALPALVRKGLCAASRSGGASDGYLRDE